MNRRLVLFILQDKCESRNFFSNLRLEDFGAGSLEKKEKQLYWIEKLYNDELTRKIKQLEKSNIYNEKLYIKEGQVTVKITSQ